MFDFLVLFFQSFRHAWKAVAHPSDEPRIRALQWVTLAGCLGGNILAVWAVINAIVFDFRSSLWFWLLMGSAVLWLVGGCVGISLEKRLQEDTGDTTPALQNAN